MKSCEVCNENQHKYKCPRCMAKYCSVACFKKHKAESCQAQEKPPEDAKQIIPNDTEHKQEDEEEETEDMVPVHMLEKLDDCQELHELLENPHLRQMLKHLNSSTNTQEDISKAMQEPIFTEFADCCLRTVEPDRQSDT